jgi:hypothetical protein
VKNERRADYMFFEAGERVGNVWERKEKVLVSMGKD